MPLPSVHVAVGIVLGLLAYIIDLRELLILVVCVIGSVCPDFDIFSGHHRVTPSHSIIVPLCLFLISTLLRGRGRKIVRWFSIAYLSHIVLDLFNWYVPLLYPLLDLCVWIHVAPAITAHGIVIYHTIEVVPCQSLPSGIPHLQDEELAPMGILFILVLALLYYVQSRHVTASHSSASPSKER